MVTASTQSNKHWRQTVNKSDLLEELELEQELLRRRAIGDFPLYAREYLKIRTKKDGIKPLILNEAQIELHNRAEKQLEEFGYVRIILLKGRQTGASTYVEGRFYWTVTNNEGVRAFILTHEKKATDNLFRMAKRFHDKMPDSIR